MMPVRMVATSREEYAAFLRRKKELIEQSVNAAAHLLYLLIPPGHQAANHVSSLAMPLAELLTLETSAELAELEKPLPDPPVIPEAMQHLGPVEMSMDWEGALQKAQGEVDLWQERLENLHAAMSATGPMKDLAAIWKVALLPMAEDALKSAESRRDWVMQRQMEKP